jgi:hypothetical protein
MVSFLVAVTAIGIMVAAQRGILDSLIHAAVVGSPKVVK